MTYILSSPAVLCIFLTVTFLSPGCSQSGPTEIGAVGISSWKVRITTTGGFIGRGAGDVNVSSDGKSIVTKPVGNGEMSRPCAAKLNEADLRLVNDAVRSSKPSGWKVAGLNIAAPDAFGYSLELQTEGAAGKQTYRIEWYDNTENKLPEDARKLNQAVSSSRSLAMKNCP